MEWNRSETAELAAPKCPLCKGTGFIVDKVGPEESCKCVLRSIFRQCYSRFVECALSGVEGSRSREHAITRELPGMWSRKNEEYVADFLLISKRTLTPDEHRIFRYRYILGADWQLCCRKLEMDKGHFHHACYRIQHKLGRIFFELEPYGLFPVASYFATGMHSREPRPTVIRSETPAAPAKRLLPLRRAA